MIPCAVSAKMKSNQLISDSESVVRILHPEWIEDGVLLHEAFMLDMGETYLSVNRPVVESFPEDVAGFLNKHNDYIFDANSYKRAVLNVGDIRSIAVSLDGIAAKIDVEVEPRDSHTKSHAGIFTRFQNKNIKRGQTLTDGTLAEGVSADTILLEVRMNLVDISSIEECQF